MSTIRWRRLVGIGPPARAPWVREGALIARSDCWRRRSANAAPAVWKLRTATLTEQTAPIAPRTRLTPGLLRSMALSGDSGSPMPHSRKRARAAGARAVAAGGDPAPPSPPPCMGAQPRRCGNRTCTGGGEEGRSPDAAATRSGGVRARGPSPVQQCLLATVWGGWDGICVTWQGVACHEGTQRELSVHASAATPLTV